MLLDFPIQICTIEIGLSVYILRGHRSEFPNYDLYPLRLFLPLITNCADPDEMPHYSKTCLEWPIKNRHNKDLTDRW